jgi:hypothetical protein
MPPSRHYHPHAGDGDLCGMAQSLFLSPDSRPTLNPKKASKIMFGLVLVLTLVMMTVAPPFIIIARAKAKSRRK